jgi:hypothetical protein
MKKWITALTLVTVFTGSLTIVSQGGQVTSGGSSGTSGSTKVVKSKPAAPIIPPLVASVDAAGGHVTIKEKKGDTSYQINQFTRIRVNGKNAKLEDVKAGMKVSVTIGSDGKTLAALEADDYTPAKTATHK